MKGKKNNRGYGFQPDEKLLDFEPLMQLDHDKDKAREQLVEEVRRLNEITINSKNNYFKLYQELLKKDNELKIKNRIIEEIQVKFESVKGLEKELARLKHVEEEYGRLKVAYENDIRANQDVIEEMRKEMNDQNEDIIVKANMIEEYQNKLALLNTQADRQTANFKNLVNEKAALGKELKEKEVIIEELKVGINRQDNKLDKKDLLISELQQEIMLIKDEKYDKKDSELKKYWNLKMQEVYLKSEMDRIKEKNESLEEEVRGLKEEKRQNLELIQIKAGKIERLDDEIRDLRNKHTDERQIKGQYEIRLNEELVKIKEIIAKQKEAEYKVEGMRAIIGEKEERIKELEDKISHVNEDRENLKNEIIQSHEENSELKAKLEKFYEDLQQMREIYDDQVDTLANKLTGVTNTNFELRADLEGLKKDKKHLQTKLVTVNRQLARKDLDYQEMINRQLYKLSEADLVEKAESHDKVMKDNYNARVEFEDACGLNDDEYLNIFSRIKSLKI